jgi:hypothetical protein
MGQMASGNKQRMTMAKRDRENKLRERRLDKKARKEARKLASGSDELGLAPEAALDGAGAEEAGEADRETGDVPADT